MATGDITLGFPLKGPVLKDTDIESNFLPFPPEGRVNVTVQVQNLPAPQAGVTFFLCFSIKATAFGPQLIYRGGFSLAGAGPLTFPWKNGFPAEITLFTASKYTNLNNQVVTALGESTVLTYTPSVAEISPAALDAPNPVAFSALQAFQGV